MGQLVDVPMETKTAAAIVMRQGRHAEAAGWRAAPQMPPDAGDPLIALMEQTADAAGLSDTEIDLELALYNTERRA